MFNPERVLGGLIRGGMRRKSGMRSLITGGAALGLVGIAMEAVEHYLNRPANTPSIPPPAPGSTAQAGRSAPPPPPDTSMYQPSMAQQADTVLLIRAMIAAAYADGAVDERERAAIMEKLTELALSTDEQQFIISELLAPKNRKSIVSAVTSPEMAQQVYIVSLLAVEVDSDAEREYLKALAQELGLDQATAANIHQRLGLPLPV